MYLAPGYWLLPLRTSSCSLDRWPGFGSFVRHKVQLVLSTNHFLLPVDVKRRDDFWKRHVGRDGPRDAHLVNLQVGVWGDDSSGRKVHALAHEVTSDSAFLPFKALFYGFQGTARLLHCLWERQKKVYLQAHRDVVLNFGVTSRFKLPWAGLAIHCPPWWPRETEAVWRLRRWRELQLRSVRSASAGCWFLQCQQACESSRPVKERAKCRRKHLHRRQINR